MLNRVVLQGRLTRDPELKTTRNNIEVCSFTVAWSEKYKDHERKLFCNCTAWRQTGAFVSRYFVKGSPILVEGSLETRKYTVTSRAEMRQADIKKRLTQQLLILKSCLHSQMTTMVFRFKEAVRCQIGY